MEIYVGNLPFTVEEDELRNMFAQHGAVDRVQIVMDKFTGRSRGFGFVSMNDVKEAQAAIEALHGADLGGRALTVNQARPKEDRRPSFGGGGGGGGGGGFSHGRGGRGGGRGDRGDRRRDRFDS